MKIMIIDGNSILNRAFFGVRPLSAPDGTPTNAVFGFINIFNRVYNDIKPDGVCVAFDVHAPTFRHKADSSYKATRKPMPDDLKRQLPVIKEVLYEMGINTYELEGYEADDLLGSVSRICQRANDECVVVTGDKDSLQLVTDKTSVAIIKTSKGETLTTVYTPDVFREEYGFEPLAMIDLKALMGDSSDNIPGVPGIGEKGAMDLIRAYGSIDNIYKDIAGLDIKEGLKQKLISGETSARQSYWLATIFPEAPVEFNPEDNLWNESFRPGLYDVLRRLGFNKLIDKYNLKPGAVSGKAESASLKDDSKAPEKSVFPDVCADEVTLSSDNIDSAIKAIEEADYISVYVPDSLDSIEFCDGKCRYQADRISLFLEYDRLLESVFSPGIKKVSTNNKALILKLIEAGLNYDGFVFDCALAEYLISGGAGQYLIQNLSFKYLNRELNGSAALYYIYPVMNESLVSFGMDKLYYSAELPLCAVLAEIEHKGFLVDKAALYEFGESLNSQIAELEKSIIEQAGHEFNINSPKQLGAVLFEELCLPNGKKTKTGWSTSAEVLEAISAYHPIVDDVLEYRMLTKLKSTYAEGLLKAISSDGRIHTNFQMTVTATGRLSSTEPNLQNIPIRKSLGAEIRKMFIAPGGSVLIDADYSQIELRVLADISNDINMIEAFKSGHDFHAVTASNIFRIPLEFVTPEIRSKAKAVNFGIVYGMAAFTLAKDTHVSVREAKEYMDLYFSEYSSVDRYLKDVVEKAKENGYVSTLYGRRRYIPELRNSNHAVKEFGKRVALNMPIQGTAADIMKLAMISVRDAFVKEGLKARIVLQVHDELIAECPENEKERVSVILKECMENVAMLKVPLPVDVAAGLSWAEAH